MHASWVDSHCHLFSLSDPNAAIERAREAGVTAMVCVGTDLETSRQAIDLAARHPDVRATAGLHPHDASKLGVEWERLAELVESADVVGIGETGFDFHYLHSSPGEQETAFRAQIRLAKRLGRALVVHSRDAWHDTFRVLADEGPPTRTVLHCFTGGPGEARRALDLGAFLSYSGIVTFPGADEVRAAAGITPLDKLLVETDAPYLAPVPRRGRENEPALVSLVGAAVATAVGRAEGEIAERTAANAAAAFSGSDESGASS
ncbi:MAG TPA: TatD family hydrolase [Acidimicrobiia bacterium]|nr:TatD family hydrolase [Acidimicrobiia bacterium]